MQRTACFNLHRRESRPHFAICTSHDGFGISGQLDWNLEAMVVSCWSGNGAAPLQHEGSVGEVDDPSGELPCCISRASNEKLITSPMDDSGASPGGAATFCLVLNVVERC